MTTENKNYGRFYPKMLVLAAAMVTESGLLRDEDIPETPEDTTSLMIWSTLRIVCDWLAEDFEGEPFGHDMRRKSFIDYDPEMVANFLLEVALFVTNHNKDYPDRLDTRHFKMIEENRLYYQAIVCAFIDQLSDCLSFGESLSRRIGTCEEMTVEALFNKDHGELH